MAAEPAAEAIIQYFMPLTFKAVVQSEAFKPKVIPPDWKSVEIVKLVRSAAYAGYTVNY